MKRFIKILLPLLLSVTILLSIGWYFLEYDTAFTRDLLLTYARQLEDKGDHKSAVWIYNLAYMQSDNNDHVAIELAEQFKQMGNYTKAEYTLSRAIEDGGSAKLYTALCKTFVEQNKLRDAVLMLESVKDPAIQAELAQLRPATPTVSVEPGSYAQYITVELEAAGAAMYVSIDGEYPSTTTDAYTGAFQLSGGETDVMVISVGENGLVSPLTVFSYSINGVVEEVNFTDPYIEEALRNQLGIDGDRPIYSNELWTVLDFEVPEKATSCQDLAWLPYLQTLTIHAGSFTDLQVLSGMADLEVLTIWGGDVSKEDLQVIASLQKLQSLTLSHCNLSSIAPLAALTGLTYLDLSDNMIRDISHLSGMTTLNALHMKNNALTSLEEISHLTELRVLDVSYNSLVTTAPLAGLTNLTHLDISSNGLMKLEGINTLVNLTHFAATNNNLIDVDILAACTELVGLDISYNTVLSIDVLANHTKLQVLNFSHNVVDHLPQFSADCVLQTIDGSYNILGNKKIQKDPLKNLAGLTKLETIYMDYNEELSTISSLADCASLKLVNVYGTSVTSAGGLNDHGIIVNYTPK